MLGFSYSTQMRHILLHYNGHLFGLQDWAEVLKMYEKDDLYLGVY